MDGLPGELYSGQAGGSPEAAVFKYGWSAVPSNLEPHGLADSTYGKHQEDVSTNGDSRAA